MGQTVFANSRGVAHKGSSGITIAFPDVCKTPDPTRETFTIPYPNIATRARAIQQKAIGMKQPVVVSGAAGAGTLRYGTNNPKPSMASKALEVLQIKGELSRLNMTLQTLTTSDPNQWQAVIQAYAVLASALYVTVTVDDDD